MKSTLHLFYDADDRLESAYRQYGNDEAKEHLTDEQLEVLRQAMETKHES